MGESIHLNQMYVVRHFAHGHYMDHRDQNSHLDSPLFLKGLATLLYNCCLLKRGLYTFFSTIHTTWTRDDLPPSWAPPKNKRSTRQHYSHYLQWLSLLLLLPLLKTTHHPSCLMLHVLSSTHCIQT